MEYEKAEAYIRERLQAELPKERSYHSYGHTVDVLKATEEIAVREGVNGENLELLKLAALYHDSGFLIGRHDHEEKGCGIVQEKLAEFGYSAAQVEKICGMIMATKIPQSPKNHLEHILCDADLQYLGRSDFFKIGDTLFQELKKDGALETFDQWNELQVKFLEAHKFCLESTRAIRDEKKADNLQRVKDLLNKKKAPS